MSVAAASRALWAAAIFAAPGLVRRSEGAEQVALEVAAGDFDRENALVTTTLPARLRQWPHFTLTRTDNGQSVPVQVQRGEGLTGSWIIRERLRARQTRRYRLAPAKEETSAAQDVIVEDNGKQVTVRIGDKPVLVYNQAVTPSPAGEDSCYAKSGYIHPVYDPLGRVITDDFNPNHPHQHGIMFAWRETVFEGRSSNGWDQKAGLGRVEHVQLDDFAGGSVFGSFAARLRQVDLTAPGGPKPVLNETWVVRIYNLAAPLLFDIEATQTCASGTPVTVGKIHYGGLMIRGHASWQTKQDFDYLTAEGKTKQDGNQTRPAWVDMYGPIEGKAAGVAILDHPGNFRFPQPVRLHPSMPYFCFTPALLGSFAIEPGKPYVSRYRFCVHEGKLDPELARRLWQDYAHPPLVRIVEDGA